MTEPLNMKDRLKTRHFISFEQRDTPQKSAVGQENPTGISWQKIKTFLKQV
jgi:hypothetical protein